MPTDPVQTLRVLVGGRTTAAVVPARPEAFYGIDEQRRVFRQPRASIGTGGREIVVEHEHDRRPLYVFSPAR